MRIARPILLVSTPIGVIFGLREAWRLAGPGMAVLMAAMISVVGGFVWMTVRRIRQEKQVPGTDSRSRKPDAITYRRFTSHNPARQSASPTAFAALSFSRNTATPITSSSIAAADCVTSAPRLTAKPLR